MKNLLDFMGIEADRLHFSWISSAESTKFVKAVTDITARVKALGPNRRYIKSAAKVA